MTCDLTFQYLSECFELDAARGQIRWRIRPDSHFLDARSAKAWNNKFAGNVAGSPHSDGRLRVKVAYKNVFVHRIIFAIANGLSLADFGIVDHQSRDFLDNRPQNLREATASQNCMNAIPARRLKTASRKGVRFADGKWRARIQVGGKRIDLGRYETETGAAAAYASAAAELHGDFARF